MDCAPAANRASPTLRCASVIMELKGGRELRRSDLMTRFGISESTAKRDLRALIKGEQLAFIGPTKTGHYELKDGTS